MDRDDEFFPVQYRDIEVRKVHDIQTVSKQEPGKKNLLGKRIPAIIRKNLGEVIVLGDVCRKVLLP